MSGIQNIVD